MQRVSPTEPQTKVKIPLDRISKVSILDKVQDHILHLIGYWEKHVKPVWGYY